MLEKFDHLAHAAATNVSRRQMFGQLGRAAAAAAAVLVGLLPSPAEAARPLGGGGFCRQCGYARPDGSEFGITGRGRHCGEELDDCILVFEEVVRCGGEI